MPKYNVPAKVMRAKLRALNRKVNTLTKKELSVAIDSRNSSNKTITASLSKPTSTENPNDKITHASTTTDQISSSPIASIEDNQWVLDEDNIIETDEEVLQPEVPVQYSTGIMKKLESLENMITKLTSLTENMAKEITELKKETKGIKICVAEMTAGVAKVSHSMEKVDNAVGGVAQTILAGGSDISLVKFPLKTEEELNSLIQTLDDGANVNALQKAFVLHNPEARVRQFRGFFSDAILDTYSRHGGPGRPRKFLECPIFHALRQSWVNAEFDSDRFTQFVQSELSRQRDRTRRLRLASFADPPGNLSASDTVYIDYDL